MTRTTRRSTNFTVRIIDMRSFEVIHEQSYSEDVLPHAAAGDSLDRVRFAIEEAGVKMRVTINELDPDEFVPAYLENGFRHMSRHVRASTWEIEQTEPRRDNDLEAGHPDFRITTDSGDVVYLEYKNPGDCLQGHQLSWMVDAIERGETVWLMWVHGDVTPVQ